MSPSLLTPYSSLSSSSELSTQSSALSPETDPQSYKEDVVTPLELLNLYYSDGKSTGNKENKLWRKMNALLSWDNILNRGYQADLCPLLYYIITKSSVFKTLNSALSTRSSELSPKLNGLNERIIFELRKHYYNSLARNMLLFDELSRVLKAFNEAGIDVLVLKGADLAERIYPDIALRPMSDIDLLVRNEDLQKAANVLSKLAYKKFVGKNIPKHDFHDAYYQHKKTQHSIIEIHWHLVRKIFLIQIDLDELWAEAIPINYLETEALRLSHVHSLLYLCWHGSRHGFLRLIWVCDIALTVKNQQAKIDWDLVREKSLNWKISKPFLFGCHMARILLSNNFPFNNAERNGFSTVHKLICDYLVLNIQHANLKRKNSQNISNLLSWFLLQNQRDKAKHLFFRKLEARLKK